MNISAQECIVLKGVESRLAELGTAHGYRFDGDTVRLNAMFTVLDAAAHRLHWALQLYACPAAPRDAGELAGHRVAEVALPPIGELADDTESFEVSSPAWTPPGRSEQVMVLALAAGNAGRFTDVHDFFVYPATERFVQPRMSGNVGFNVEGDRVRIDVDRIENPRDAANLSGTLALELWALARPYAGGAFAGMPLAGVAFDPLPGQYESLNRSFTLPFVPPSAGQWNVVLMLREWTAAGFVTRDFANFSLPLVVSDPSPKAPEQPPQPKPAPAPAAAAPAVRPPEPKAKSGSPATAAAHLVAVNSASRQELEQVKGLPAKVAQEIVRKRPFKSLDDLLKCKGMGAKLLAQLRSRLRL